MPAQQRPRGDDQPQLAELAARQQPGQRGQHCPAGPRQPRGLDLPPEDGNLVAQDEDLRVLDTIRAGEQGKPAKQAQHREISES
jgi:hypothetical protein